MSDELSPTPPADGEEATPAAPQPLVTLDQFCQHFTRCHPVLLAGFKHGERQADRLVDTVENYTRRLEAFHHARLG